MAYKQQSIQIFELSRKQFEDIIHNSLRHEFAGCVGDMTIDYVIEEVDGHPLDFFPGHDEVTKIRLKFVNSVDNRN